MPGVEIKQGGSIGLAYGLKDDPQLNGWRCKVAVKANLDDTSPLFQITLSQLSQDQTRFVGLITRSTTNDWPLGDYHLVADLYNESTGEAVEIHADLRVTQQGIPND